MAEAHKDRINFNRGVPATGALPAEEVRKAAFEVLESSGTTLLQYGDSRGYPPLREILTEDSGEIRPEGVVVGNGSLQLLDLLAKVHLGNGESIVVEEPTYDRAITIFERAGAEVTGVAMERDGVGIANLRKAFDRYRPSLFYTIPDFQNPTGITTSRKKRQRVVRLAEEFGVTLVEDSPYRRLRYRGEQVPTIRSLSPENVIQISSFSKLVGPGIRVGWLIGEPKRVERISNYAEDTYISPNLLSQGIVSFLIRNGWLEEYLGELVSLYRPRLEATLTSLEEYFPEAEWVKPEGGFFVGVWLPEREKSKKFYREAQLRGLVLTSPDGFYPNQGGEDFLRLPFPALSPTLIEEGVKRMAEVWKDI